jgi:Cu/Zn superoxide dismutase
VKLTYVSLISAVALGCGGGAKKPTSPGPGSDLAEEAVEDVNDPVEEEPAPPPQPLEWTAQVELAPVKGVKMKPLTISLKQTEGEGVEIAAADVISGLTPGIYYFVVHESADCGKNAAKIGPAWAPAAGVALSITIAKGEPGELDSEVDYTLDGEDSIIGHTLVLHADKKGKIGKAVACGAIASTDAASAMDE